MGTILSSCLANHLLRPKFAQKHFRQHLSQKAEKVWVLLFGIFPVESRNIESHCVKYAMMRQSFAIVNWRMSQSHDFTWLVDTKHTCVLLKSFASVPTKITQICFHKVARAIFPIRLTIYQCHRRSQGLLPWSYLIECFHGEVVCKICEFSFCWVFRCLWGGPATSAPHSPRTTEVVAIIEHKLQRAMQCTQCTRLSTCLLITRSEE